VHLPASATSAPTTSPSASSFTSSFITKFAHPFVLHEHITSSTSLYTFFTSFFSYVQSYFLYKPLHSSAVLLCILVFDPVILAVCIFSVESVTCNMCSKSIAGSCSVFIVRFLQIYDSFFFFPTLFLLLSRSSLCFLSVIHLLFCFLLHLLLSSFLLSYISFPTCTMYHLPILSISISLTSLFSTFSFCLDSLFLFSFPHSSTSPCASYLLLPSSHISLFTSNSTYPLILSFLYFINLIYILLSKLLFYFPHLAGSSPALSYSSISSLNF